MESIFCQAENELRAQKSRIAKEMESEIKLLIDQFRQDISIAFKKSNFHAEIDIKAIIDQVQISFQYAITQLGDIGLSLWGIIPVFAAFGPWGAANLAALVGVRKITEWFILDPKKRKRKAKERAYKDIKRIVNKIKQDHMEQLTQELKELNKRTKQGINKVRKDISDLRGFSITMDRVINRFSEKKAQLFTMLARFLFGDKVELGYEI